MRPLDKQIEDFSEFDDPLTDEALDRQRSVSGFTVPGDCHCHTTRGRED